MTADKPKSHANIYGNVAKIITIGAVQGNVFVSAAKLDKEPLSKSQAFQLGYHLGALDFFVSYQKRGIPLSPSLPDWIDEAKNRCSVLANGIDLIVPQSPDRYFGALSEQLSAKPITIKKCFHIGNIIGRCWFFGVGPMRAGVVPPDMFILERLGQAVKLLSEADLPDNLLSKLRQNWEKAISSVMAGRFSSSDETDKEMNQVIEEIVKSIEKYNPSPSSHDEQVTASMRMVEIKRDTIKVDVVITRTGERYTVEVALDTLVRYAEDELMKMLGLPHRFENGSAVEYGLINETQQCRQLQIDLTFRENKVNDGDTLTFVPAGKMG